MSRVDLLVSQLEEVYGRLRRRVADLTEVEYFWEPVPGCWTVRRDESGAWVNDYQEPDPDPPPFTTIAWRMAHIADCKVMYQSMRSARAGSPFPTSRRRRPWRR